jgi:hypothetical protein
MGPILRSLDVAIELVCGRDELRETVKLGSSDDVNLDGHAMQHAQVPGKVIGNSAEPHSGYPPMSRGAAQEMLSG